MISSSAPTHEPTRAPCSPALPQLGGSAPPAGARPFPRVAAGASPMTPLRARAFSACQRNTPGPTSASSSGRSWSGPRASASRAWSIRPGSVAIIIEVSASQACRTRCWCSRMSGICSRRHIEIGHRDQRDVQLDRQLADHHRQRGDVAAMPVEQADAPEPMPHQRADDPAHQPVEGGKVDGDRAAELHVMFGEAGPDRRRDQDRLAPRVKLARGPHRRLRHQPEVDHDRQMRPMLLGGPNRHDDDRVLLGHSPQRRRGERGRIRAICMMRWRPRGMSRDEL